VVLSYDLPYSGTSARIERSPPLRTEDFRLLVLGEGAAAQSAALPEQRLLEAEGRPVLELAGEDLPPGRAIAVEISGLPASSGVAAAESAAAASALDPSARNQPQQALGVAAALLAILASLGALLYPAFAAGRALPVPARQARRRASLVAELAGLDRAFESGSLTREVYMARRAAVLNEALELGRQEGELGGR
jgi:hypothetical protein